MSKKFKDLFNTSKPIIAMVHLPALPGSPLYDSKLGLDHIIQVAEKDLISLQDAGVDAVMSVSYTHLTLPTIYSV